MGLERTVASAGVEHSLELAETDDRAVIEAFLRRDPQLHLYEIGDLDPFFWPKTRWFGAWQGDALQALALRYAAPGVEAVLLLERQHPEAARWLARKLAFELEHPFHAHFSLGIGELFSERGAQSAGVHRKMTLRPEAELPPRRDGVRRVGDSDLAAVHELYAAAYPENWFDPAMVATGQYFGAWDDERLCAVAGIHVFAPKLRVAALGNITTHPGARGRGWGRAVTAAVCSSLREAGVESIGLNVKADNEAAIACYRRLAFDHEADYEEWDVERVQPP